MSNPVTFRRKFDHDHVVTVLCGAGTHVDYRMSNGVEATLPRPTFEEDFEPLPDGLSAARGIKNGLLLSAVCWLLLLLLLLWWLR